MKARLSTKLPAALWEARLLREQTGHEKLFIQMIAAPEKNPGVALAEGLAAARRNQAKREGRLTDLPPLDFVAPDYIFTAEPDTALCLAHDFDMLMRGGSVQAAPQILHSRPCGYGAAEKNTACAELLEMSGLAMQPESVCAWLDFLRRSRDIPRDALIVVRLMKAM